MAFLFVLPVMANELHHMTLAKWSIDYAGSFRVTMCPACPAAIALFLSSIVFFNVSFVGLSV